MKKAKKKRGQAIEESVAEIVRAIDPQSTVSQGQWINGPDGRRDRDVFIEGTVDGAAYTALIECKEYDRTTTGPVGITVVDALDSKRRDLQVDIAIICSNAGFTDPAVRKATRVGIVLIGVFRQDDGRIRLQLIDQVYFRRLKIEHLGFRPEHAQEGTTRECTDVSATLQGQPVANWLCHHTISIIASNPIGGGHYAGVFAFKRPTEFNVVGGDTFIATQMFAEFAFSGGWFEQ
jgi:Restriction endonuclease